MIKSEIFSQEFTFLFLIEAWFMLLEAGKKK
jgi:hypothetical protein